MVKVEWLVLLLPVAAGLSACLAVFAFAVPPRRSPATKFFVMLNLAATFWATGSFLRVAVGLPRPPATYPPLTGGWWTSVLLTTGVVALPAAWFFFAAAQTRRLELLGRGPLLAWTGWAVVVGGLALTNYYHGLATPPDLANGGSVAFSFVPLILLVGGSMIALSVGMIVVDLYGRGDFRHRRTAVLLAVCGALPLAGAALWVTQAATGLHIPYDPTPVLIIPMSILLAFEVLRSGLADVMPLAASRAFQAMSDIAIVTDDRLVIIATNAAAERELPEAATGVPLADVLPDAARHAADCLTSDVDYIPFELRREGNVYWGRAHCTQKRKGTATGYVVLLSDITDLRYAQEQLLKITDPGTGRTTTDSRMPR